MALKTASLRMQLASGVIILGHAYEQIMDTKATAVACSINIHSAEGHEMFHFFVTHYTMFDKVRTDYTVESFFRHSVIA